MKRNRCSYFKIQAALRFFCKFSTSQFLKLQKMRITKK